MANAAYNQVKRPDLLDPAVILSPGSLRSLLTWEFPGFDYVSTWGAEGLWMAVQNPTSDVSLAIRDHLGRVLLYGKQKWGIAQAKAFATKQLINAAEATATAMRTGQSVVELLQVSAALQRLLDQAEAAVTPAPADDGVLFPGMKGADAFATPYERRPALGLNAQVGFSAGQAGVDWALQPLESLIQDAFVNLRGGEAKVLAGATQFFLSEVKYLVGVELAQAVMLGLQALSSLVPAVGSLGAAVSGALAAANAATAGVVGTVVGAAAVVASAAGPLAVLAMFVVAIVLWAVVPGAEARLEVAGLRRRYAQQCAAEYVPATASGDGGMRPVDFFWLNAPDGPCDGRLTLKQPSVALQLLAVDRADWREEAGLLTVQAIPVAELSVIRRLRVALHTNAFGTATSLLLWPLYMDLVCAQFAEGRVRFLTSEELGNIASQNCPSKFYRPSPESPLEAVDVAQPVVWAHALLAAYKREGWLAPQKMPAIADDPYVYEPDLARYVNAGRAGWLWEGHTFAQEALLALVNDWKAQHGRPVPQKDVDAALNLLAPAVPGAAAKAKSAPKPPPRPTAKEKLAAARARNEATAAALRKKVIAAADASADAARAGGAALATALVAAAGAMGTLYWYVTRKMRRP